MPLYGPEPDLRELEQLLAEVRDAVVAIQAVLENISQVQLPAALDNGRLAVRSGGVL